MFEAEQHGDVTIVTPTGELGAANAAAAKAYLVDLIENGSRRILVDLALLDFLDSSALGVLVTTLKTVREVGGGVRLCGLTPHVKTIFQMTRLERVFDIAPDRDTALQGW